MRRNLAAARLAILTQLEYRLNFTIDAVIQPILTATVETALWLGIFSALGAGELGGFGRESYLAYALWANFVSRVTTNWMYEYNMLDEIDSGRVNAILMRPISFYEFYLSQFMGYKFLVAVISFVIPLTFCFVFGFPVQVERFPVMLLFVMYYLIFVHTLSFCVACLAFYLNRAHSFTGVKNLAIWVMAGEMIPLDLYPEPLKSLLLHSPFASGVYVPVGFMTGRVGFDYLGQSVISVTVGILVIGLIGRFLWKRGLRVYSGTGA